MARKRTAPPSPIIDSVAAAQARFEKLSAQAVADPDSMAALHPVEGNPRTLAARILPPDEWVAKQLERTAAAGETWKERTLHPRKDPIAEAKKAAPKWKAKMQEAIQKDSFAKGLDAVDEDAMIETIEQTPPSVFTDGVRRRERKIKGKIEKLAPLLAANVESLDAMPDTTDAEREAKMLANLRNMKTIGDKMKT